tara:strand:- start:191 stop:529 length:339 start_codon:yes stop_codon:yes gene_type:complete
VPFLKIFLFLLFLFGLSGCASSYRGDRVEQMRFGVPALFALEIDYYKDLENKNEYSSTDHLDNDVNISLKPPSWVKKIIPRPRGMSKKEYQKKARKGWNNNIESNSGLMPRG